MPWGFRASYRSDGLRPFPEAPEPVYDKPVFRPRTHPIYPNGAVGQPLATRQELLSRTPLQPATPDCWMEGLLPPGIGKLCLPEISN